MTFEIELNPEQLNKLQKRAKMIGRTPEEAVFDLIDPLIEGTDEEFEGFVKLMNAMNDPDMIEELENMLEDYDDQNDYEDEDDDDEDESDEEADEKEEEVRLKVIELNPEKNK